MSQTHHLNHGRALFGPGFYIHAFMFWSFHAPESHYTLDLLYHCASTQQTHRSQSLPCIVYLNSINFGRGTTVVRSKCEHNYSTSFQMQMHYTCLWSILYYTRHRRCMPYVDNGTLPCVIAISTRANILYSANRTPSHALTMSFVSHYNVWL